MDESNVTHESKKCCGAVGEGIDRLSLYIRVRDEYAPNDYTPLFGAGGGKNARKGRSNLLATRP